MDGASRHPGGHDPRSVHRAVAATATHAQVPAPNPQGPKANWALFDKFSTINARGMTFSTTVTPRWADIGGRRTR
jgi:hypothetical protein